MITYARSRSCSSCQSSVDYGNTKRPGMHFTGSRIMYICPFNLNSRVVSSGVHTKQRSLAAGFKAYYPTERTEHATIAWSDRTIQVYIIIFFFSF